ncbi:predicted protein, partial [Nematostella vectensis]
IFPGTNWCGSGNDAKNFDDLGEFNKTDQCCREHDYCPNWIPPFERKFDFFNFSPFTLLDCKCETRLFNCLWGVDDEQAAIFVGRMYFNYI